MASGHQTAMRTLASSIAAHAARDPDGAAFLGDGAALSWRGYDLASTQLAARLCELRFAPGERIGVLLPDGPGVHVAFVATEKAGLVSVGIGPRAGLAEVEHLLRLSGATGLLSGSQHQGHATTEIVERLRGAGLPLRHHLIDDGEFLGDESQHGSRELAGRAVSIDDLFLLNSTSGTTGMPKCVTHDQRRWLEFHACAVPAGALSANDVFLSAISAPFGFGIWTAHVTPTVLGAPTVLLSRFSPEQALELIERHRVSVLAAVSTQFMLMLDALERAPRALSSLRVLFTGGEAVPYERAAEFEDRTGARVLQFYGSNETGAVSGTTLEDSREQRLRTAGRPLPAMNLRLFDEQGRDVTSSGRGQPGCKGPTLSRGYYGDDAANARLIRDDGWMLLGDLVTIDSEGYLSVVGRTDDFIIRGGKNISAPGVERAVATHPAVAIAAAVAMPDRTFGERVCVYVELHPGQTLTLEEVVTHLAANDVSVETFPEHLVVMDALPRGSGGKIAKGDLREDIKHRRTT
jgi:acyl-CoA synthetase